MFATEAAADRYPDLARDASLITDRDAAALSETVTPQGLVAVCRLPVASVDEVVSAAPTLLVLLVEPNDPGNLGTIVRTADAAGADAVLVDGGVDPQNGKAVRASAGSLFHLPVVPAASGDVLAAVRAAHVTSLATTGAARRTVDDLDDAGDLSRPTLWIFGTEAHGLPHEVLAGADEQVRIPIHGRAESLNLAAAAAVCLYASARAQRPR